jgi:hypothetical protein
MDARDDNAASKLIDVLKRIDTTLETLDRRLQSLENATQTAPPGIGFTSAPNADRVELTNHVGFTIKHKVGPWGSNEVHEITVENREFLCLLSEASSPCLNRHRDAQTEQLESKSFPRPFTELLSYRDVLKFAINPCSQPDNELPNLLSHRLLTADQRGAAAELLRCLDDQCKTLFGRRDANLSRGVVLYDDLPSLYAPGSLLVAPGESGLDRVVEVSSCDMLTGPATSEACVVQVWYFRWDGRAFSRASERFLLGRYTGTRPINGLPYRPLFSPDLESSATKLKELHSRNHANITALEEILDAEIEDYPCCSWTALPRRASGTVSPTRLVKPCPPCRSVCQRR